jgi:hypothetical protein
MNILPHVFGIGRPNIGTALYGDTRGLGNFTLHMSIENLPMAEVAALQKMIDDSLDTDDRKAVKKELHKLLKAADNFKGGHRLIDALSDRPSEDIEPEP